MTVKTNSPALNKWARAFVVVKTEHFFSLARGSAIINNSKHLGQNSGCRLCFSTTSVMTPSYTISRVANTPTITGNRKSKCLWFQRLGQILQHITLLVHLEMLNETNDK